MDLSAISPVLLLAALMVAATPILLAAIGELVVEQAGVLNLGAEGMRITGAICGFITAVGTGSTALGVAGAAAGGAALARIFGVRTRCPMSNQAATGLALTLFGIRRASLPGQGYVGVRAARSPTPSPADVNAEAEAEAGAMIAAITAVEYHPFAGPITKQDSTPFLAGGEVATDEQLVTMNFCVEGMPGEIRF